MLDVVTRKPTARDGLGRLCRVEVIDTPDRWAALSREWNELLGESRSDTVCLTWEWLYAWMESFQGRDRRLFILAVSDGDELIGIAPWCIRRLGIPPFTVKQIEFLGVPEAGSDGLDVFARAGRERDVALALFGFLFREASDRWDCMLLEDIPASSGVLFHLLAEFAETGKHVELQPGNVSPFLVLPRTEQDFRASLSAHRRNHFLRDWRLLGRTGEVEHETLAPGSDRAGLGRFIASYTATRPADRDPRLVSFLQGFAALSSADGRLQFDFLKRNGSDIAALLHIQYKGTLSAYLIAVDRSASKRVSVGNVLFGLCLERAIQDDIRVYDFLKGQAGYKFHWARDGRLALNLCCYRRRPAVVVLAGLRFVRQLGKVVLR